MQNSVQEFSSPDDAMGNKRQRLARKQFKVVTGGDAAPKPNTESKVVGSTGKGSKQRKKNLIGKKRKTAEGNEIIGADKPERAVFQEHYVKESEGDAVPAHTKSSDGEAKTTGQNIIEKNSENATRNKISGSVHPLRALQIKSGEGCFICRGTDHFAKLCPSKPADRKKICLLCRRIGHTLKNCPTSVKSEKSDYCYNCGEDGHGLAACKEPLKSGGTGFAECFVCKKKGHLSKSCPNNPNGIYPKGGCCKLCQGVTHLAKDCPTRKPGGRIKLQISSAVAQVSNPGGGGKRRVFQSGDDLGDDFVSDDEVGDTIVGALSYGSDDTAPEGGLKIGSIKNIPKPKSKEEGKQFLKIGSIKNIPKPKSKKEGKQFVKVNPNTIGSTKMQHTSKVIQFQRQKKSCGQNF